MWSASLFRHYTPEGWVPCCPLVTQTQSRCDSQEVPFPCRKSNFGTLVLSHSKLCCTVLCVSVTKTVFDVLTKWRGRIVWRDKCVKTNILRLRVPVCALSTMPLFAYNRSCCPDGGSALRFVSVCRVAELTGKNMTPKPLIHKHGSNLHLQFRIHAF